MTMRQSVKYLSGMKKTDKFIPVITIVIYYGEKPWDGAVSLHGMLNIPKAMETFVNDYKIHLVEAGKNNLVLHNVNNQDLFNLLEILLSRSGRTDGKKEKAIDYDLTNWLASVSEEDQMYKNIELTDTKVNFQELYHDPKE